MKVSILSLLIFCAGVVTAMALPKSDRGFPMAGLVELRARDTLLDTVLKYVNMEPLNKVSVNYKARSVFRLISSSSWGTDIITVCEVGGAKLRVDDIKSPSGYIMILDRVGWENTDVIYAGKRTVRFLKPEEIEPVKSVVTAKQLKDFSSEMQRLDSGQVTPVADGITIFEWIDRHQTKTLWVTPSPAGSTGARPSLLLDTLVPVFYKLVN